MKANTNTKKQKADLVKGLLTGKIALSDINPPEYRVQVLYQLHGHPEALYDDNGRLTEEQYQQVQDNQDPSLITVVVIETEYNQEKTLDHFAA